MLGPPRLQQDKRKKKKTGPIRGFTTVFSTVSIFEKKITYSHKTPPAEGQNKPEIIKTSKGTL